MRWHWFPSGPMVLDDGERDAQRHLSSLVHNVHRVFRRDFSTQFLPNTGKWCEMTNIRGSIQFTDGISRQISYSYSNKNNNNNKNVSRTRKQQHLSHIVPRQLKFESTASQMRHSRIAPVCLAHFCTWFRFFFFIQIRLKFPWCVEAVAANGKNKKQANSRWNNVRLEIVTCLFCVRRFCFFFSSFALTSSQRLIFPHFAAQNWI